jgi:cell division protein FtsW
MTRERRQQLNKEEQEKSNRRSPLSVRSPALEAAEQKRANGTSRSRLASRQSHASRNARHARFAVEETLSRPGIERKKLPKLKAPLVAPEVEREHSGITAGWRVRKKPEPPKPEPPAGISEEEERRLAELEMRLPRVAGKIDSWLLVTVLILLCIGVVMVYSASSFTAARDMGDASFYFQRELIWALLGIVAMFVTMRVDYRQWRRFSLIGIVVVVPLLVIVLKFGQTAYGASRWLAFGSFFSFQPSELTKLVLTLYIADWLARKGKQVGTFLYGLAPFILLVGLILGLVLLENDLGTAIIIAGFATAMFFTAGANIVQFLVAMAGGVLVFLMEAFKGYRYYRIIGFLDPFKDVTGINLQLYQALLAFGSGGWFGLGLGASRQKAGWLPFPFTDSIFPIIGEELGFAGCALIVGLFLFLAFRGFRLARRARDLYGALLATGITTWLVLQAMVNIGANTATIPYTGVPLPFISFGGSSLVVSLAAVGVLLNISRYIQEPEKPALSRSTITLRKKQQRVTYTGLGTR